MIRTDIEMFNPNDLPLPTDYLDLQIPSSSVMKKTLDTSNIKDRDQKHI